VLQYSVHKYTGTWVNSKN